MYRQYNSNSIKKIDNDLIDPDFKYLLEEETKILNEEERKWREKFNNVSLKFSYNGETLTIASKKTDKVGVLKLQIMKDFNINTEPNNVRIRTVNPTNNKLVNYFINEELVSNIIHISNIIKYN